MKEYTFEYRRAAAQAALERVMRLKPPTRLRAASVPGRDRLEYRRERYRLNLERMRAWRKENRETIRYAEKCGIRLAEARRILRELDAKKARTHAA